MAEKSINIAELDNAVSTLNSLPFSPELKNAINGVRELFPSGMQTKSYRDSSGHPTKVDIEQKVRALELEIKKLEQKYKQPVFKCLSDYKVCCHESSKLTCTTLLIICMANQFVSIKVNLSNSEGDEGE